MSLDASIWAFKAEVKTSSQDLFYWHWLIEQESLTNATQVLNAWSKTRFLTAKQLLKF